MKFDQYAINGITGYDLTDESTLKKCNIKSVSLKSEMNKIEQLIIEKIDGTTEIFDMDFDKFYQVDRRNKLQKIINKINGTN